MIIEQEQWIKWTPIDNLSKKFYIRKVDIYKNSCLIDFFSDEKNHRTMYMTFKKSIIFYKTINEICAQDTIYNFKLKTSKEFITQWTFFKIINSTLIQSLKKESYDLLDTTTLQHFVIMEIESFTEIIATEEPIVKWM